MDVQSFKTYKIRTHPSALLWTLQYQSKNNTLPSYADDVVTKLVGFIGPMCFEDTIVNLFIEDYRLEYEDIYTRCLLTNSNQYFEKTTSPTDSEQQNQLNPSEKTSRCRRVHGCSKFQCLKHPPALL